MFWVSYMFMIFYFSGVFVYCSKRKHLLLVLLSLEYLVLFTFGLLVLYFNNVDHGIFIVIIYLIFSVCEGVLGLSLLVNMVRCHGNDYFQSYMVLRC
uniref:NADH dehydrogenase subunit 4L n=1 Tax=Vescelia pieli TaxID=2526987 RepID=UPI0030E10D2D